MLKKFLTKQSSCGIIKKSPPFGRGNLKQRKGSNMKEKAIVILNGRNEGKTQFVEIAKKNDYWVWNLNYNNVIAMVAHKVGWDGERNENYSNFVKEFSKLSKKYFNAEFNYIEGMAQKFSKNPKANLLIIHGSTPEISKHLQENYNSYTINIAANEDAVDNNTKYCKVLNFSDNKFEQEVKNTLNVLTKELKGE